VRSVSNACLIWGATKRHGRGFTRCDEQWSYLGENALPALWKWMKLSLEAQKKTCTVVKLTIKRLWLSPLKGVGERLGGFVYDTLKTLRERN